MGWYSYITGDPLEFLIFETLDDDLHLFVIRGRTSAKKPQIEVERERLLRNGFQRFLRFEEKV